MLSGLNRTFLRLPAISNFLARKKRGLQGLTSVRSEGPASIAAITAVTALPAACELIKVC
jgi:hypothetical protein